MFDPDIPNISRVASPSRLSCLLNPLSLLLTRWVLRHVRSRVHQLHPIINPSNGPHLPHHTASFGRLLFFRGYHVVHYILLVPTGNRCWDTVVARFSVAGAWTICCDHPVSSSTRVINRRTSRSFRCAKSSKQICVWSYITPLKRATTVWGHGWTAVPP